MQRTRAFAAPKCGPLRYSLFRTRVFAPAIKRAGLDGLTFHGLRHAAATAWVAAGVDLRIAQHRLGHSTPRLVLELYAYATTEADRAAADLMGTRLFGSCDTRVARHTRAMESCRHERTLPLTRPLSCKFMRAG